MNGQVDELDGLRGIAILLVLVRHFGDFVPTSLAAGFLEAIVLGGNIGVDLFFVLSGFLITGICLDHQGGRGFYRAFYARRALRILPPYLLLLVVLTGVSLTASGQMPAGFVYLATFTTNIAEVIQRRWRAVADSAAHLWSLAVEEQFYLIWPALLAWLGASRSVAAAFLIPCALVVRAVIVTHDLPQIVVYVLTPARMDTLAIGALLAIAWRNEEQWRRICRLTAPLAGAPLGYWAFGLAAVLFCVAVEPGGDLVMQTVGYSAVAVLGGVTLASALSAPMDTPLRRALRFALLRRVGKYSYAMYLFHYPISVAVTRVVGIRRGVAASVVSIAFGTVITYAVASASWRIVERPFLSLKRRFPYQRFEPSSEREVVVPVQA